MPAPQAIGYALLQSRFGLPDVPLPNSSYIASSAGWREVDGMRQRHWLGSAWPGDHWCEHLEFALKHEGLNLQLLWHLFRKTDEAELLAHITSKPAGKYARKAGFLFEWLTGRELPLATALTGNYEPLLDDKRYLTAPNKPNTRWRVHDNLPGTPAFCPLIERAPLQAGLGWTPTAALAELREHYDAALFARATAWLYLMETRSTNEIESETPSPKRAERFVQQLKNAGQLGLQEALSHDALVTLQESFVDPKGRVPVGLRNIQNYVGSEGLYGSPKVAYPCPPPELAVQLLDALATTVARTEGQHPVVRAAVASFGFVYIHPFEDGNGRISRYLIHDVLVREGFTPAGFIFPVSAVILKRLVDYTTALERHSEPVLRLAEYHFDPLSKQLVLENPELLEPLYRYPDLTAQTAFLMDATRECAEVALVQELAHLDAMERAKQRLRETVDIEDRRLNLLLAMIHQNGGQLSKNKRTGEFADLDDAEIAHAQQCYEEAFRGEQNR